MMMPAACQNPVNSTVDGEFGRPNAAQLYYDGDFGNMQNFMD